ncbi:hypothetical protein ACR30L_18690 [Psychromonas sp. PT13]|uniref:hypothetical protein n=1 Tax=Psychromonas sp. PT13 TaxID=3439547 RepID=UPI003EB974C5
MKYIRKTVLFFLVLVGSNACGNEQKNGSQLVDVNTNNETVKHRSYLAELGLVLPDKAKIIHFYQEKGGELFIRLKIEMDFQTFNNWMISLNNKEEYFIEDNRYLLGPDFEQWQPSKEPTLFAMQIASDQGLYLNLGITSKVEENKVVYIVFHGS